MVVIVVVPVLVIMVEVEEGVEGVVSVEGEVVDGQRKTSPGTTDPFSAQIYIVHMSPSGITATDCPTSYLVPLMTQGHAGIGAQSMDPEGPQTHFVQFSSVGISSPGRTGLPLT